jgi:hypothetical protein
MFKERDIVVIRIEEKYYSNYNDRSGVVLRVRDEEPKFLVKTELERPIFFSTEELSLQDKTKEIITHSERRG